MRKKLTYSLGMIAALFIFGCIFLYSGFAIGNEIAVNLSRPMGASSWITSENMVNACTYTSVIIGMALILLAIGFSCILFATWLKE